MNPDLPKPLKQAKRNKDQDVRRYADYIERFYSAYGIQLEVVEVSPEADEVQYACRIALGTYIDSILKYQDELAVVLGAPNYRVRIDAPIPGRDLIGISIPRVERYDPMPEQKLEERIKKGEEKLQLYLRLSAQNLKKAEDLAGPVICLIQPSYDN